jgi:hypothetical protein
MAAELWKEYIKIQGQNLKLKTTGPIFDHLFALMM